MYLYIQFSHRSVLLTGKQYGDFASKQTNTGIDRSACEIACL